MAIKEMLAHETFRFISLLLIQLKHKLFQLFFFVRIPILKHLSKAYYVRLVFLLFKS